MSLGGSVPGYVVDGSGSVVALSDGGLWLFAPGSDMAVPIAGPSGSFPSAPELVGTVSQVAVDGSGEVVALIAGSLVRFAVGGLSAQEMSTGVSKFVVDGTGSVYALQGQSVYLYGPGSTTGREIIYPGFAAAAISNIVADSSGSVMALDSSGNLSIISPGSVICEARRADAITPSLPATRWSTGSLFSRLVSTRQDRWWRRQLWA